MKRFKWSHLAQKKGKDEKDDDVIEIPSDRKFQFSSPSRKAPLEFGGDKVAETPTEMPQEVELEFPGGTNYE